MLKKLTPIEKQKWKTYRLYYKNRIRCRRVVKRSPLYISRVQANKLKNMIEKRNIFPARCNSQQLNKG